MPGPYGFGESENAMEMIRHNNEGIQDNTRKMNRYCIPTRNHDVPCLAAYHQAIRDLTEDALPVSRAKSDEVRSGLGIIEFRQPELLPESRCIQMIRLTRRAVPLKNLPGVPGFWAMMKHEQNVADSPGSGCDCLGDECPRAAAFQRPEETQHGVV